MSFDEESRVDKILEIWHKATPQQRKKGRTWYLSAHDFALQLSYKYRHSLRTTAGLLACLDYDKILAVKILNNEDVAYNQARDFRALQISDPDNILSFMPRSLYRCIYNPMTDEVYVDSQSATIAGHFNERITEEDYPVLQSLFQEAGEIIGIFPSIIQATVSIVLEEEVNGANT